MLAAGPAHAQSAPDPAAIERTIPTQQRGEERVPLVPKLPRGKPVGAGGAVRFTLGTVNVDGATAFSQAELTRPFERYLATEVDGKQLAQMAARITERYRSSGYLLSYAMVPTQSVEAGMVRLAVVEGRIAQVTVSGAGADAAAIEAIAEPVINAAPLKAATLERALGLIRDFPGLSVTDVALMRTDPERGLYALKIALKRNRVRAFTYADNRGSESAARLRFYSSASLSSVALPGDEVKVDMFAMPGRSFRYLYGQVLAGVPIGRHGLRLTMSASNADQDLDRLERLDGDSRNLTAQLSYPVLRSRELTMVGKLSLTDWQSSASEHGVVKLRDRLRVARAGVELSTETRTRLHGEFSLSHGLGFDGMTRVGDALASRTNAGGRFTKAAFSLLLTRPLADDFKLQGMLAAQYSDRPLLSGEEFALGGSRIGRAFAFNALTGSRGIGGAVELSYRLAESKSKIATPTLFGFADAGAVFNPKALDSTYRRRGLASMGAGTRFGIGGAVFSLEAGIPVAARGRDKSVRLFFSTYRSF